jgi:inhibitor of Bruton tyrosine kinase
MVNSAIQYLETRTCTQKCRSQKHAEELISILTKTSDASILLSAVQQCWNCAKIHDAGRRYLIHMAASCGRLDVIEWLIRYKNADLNVKTLENGWNPAHCAAFHGKIGALVILMKYGCNINVVDDDKLTLVENLALDKWKAIKNESITNGILL